MTRLPIITPKEVIRRLKRANFQIDTIVGSHYTLRSQDGKRRVTVPYHNKGLKRKTIKSILIQADLTNE